MIVLYVLLGLIILSVLSTIIMYNRLVILRNRTENAWSQVNVQLKKRHDLIPNLVETVKGYAAHEKELFEKVTEARAKAVSAGGVAETGQAENMLTGTLRSLFAVAENYPDLKANQNFLLLQEELSGVENKIAFARQFYNDSAYNYDNAMETFPTSLIASAFNFKPIPYFEIEEGESKPVNVKF